MNDKCILIIEDEKSIQDILKLALEMEGFKVYTADNGKQAMGILPQMKRPCLILLDLMMPVMNGWEFAEEISKDSNLSTIPIVLITAYGDRAKQVAAKGILKKPIDLDSLLKIVNQWCSGAA